MGRPWQFFDGSSSAPLVVTTWIDATEDQRRDALSFETARWEIARTFEGPRRHDHRHHLVEMCRAAGDVGFEASRIGTMALMQRVLDAVRQRRLLVTRSREIVETTGGGSGPAREEPPPPPPERPPPVRRPPPPREELSWIEIQVKDEAGLPYCGRISLGLPNGAKVNATTDATGTLRLDGILPGPCTVTLPDVSERLRVS